MCVCAGRGGLAPGGSCPRSAGAETHVSPASASPPQFWRVCPSSARAAGAAPLTRVSRVRSRRRHTLPGAAHDVPLPTRPWELRCHPTTRYTNSPWRAGPARATPPRRSRRNYQHPRRLPRWRRGVAPQHTARGIVLPRHHIKRPKLGTSRAGDYASKLLPASFSAPAIELVIELGRPRPHVRSSVMRRCVCDAVPWAAFACACVFPC